MPPTSPPAGASDLTSLLQSVQVWIWGFVGLAAIVMLSVVALMFICGFRVKAITRFG